MASAMASRIGTPMLLATDSATSSSNDASDDTSSSDSSLDSSDEVTAAPAGPTVADPSVIVGMACRVAGATNPSELWKAIAEKKDSQRKMPEDRFNVDAFYHPSGANKGTTNAKYGYFLDQGLDLFDNEFFKISGKEAEAMDPQQRILLEVVYEALEDAGITLDEINGTQTSVFAGSFTNDYSSMTTKDLSQYPKYTVTGQGNAIISNRISYVYNLHGPSMTLDTACSSSLVCFHLGNRSLQAGESDVTIVVGSALHFDPNIFITMTDFGMLSTDGRCRTFDANGSGYVRGEGVSAVIMKKRSVAEMAGDNIKAIVRGTGSNHDGVKDGLTLPNGVAQAALLRSTYKNAGLSTADTGYFEAHGTGTKAGDPLEANAIGSVFAPDRDQPLYVGSVKSNLGHLEGASGLAGVIKATLSVESAKILPNMHFHTPNPAIDFKGLKIEVPTEVIDWKSETGVRRASVNSFGYGGSNAHVILENYRQKPSVLRQNRLSNALQADKRPFLVPLTSHSEDAGKLLVSSISGYVQGTSFFKSSDLAHSMSFRRSMHRYRSFTIGADAESLLKDLSEPKPIAKWTRALEGSPKIGFVFTGQGAQWHAMGRQLIEQCTLFRQTIEKCDEVLRALPDSPDWTCVGELLKSAESSRLSQSRFSQPLCAALQLGLVDLLKAWSIEPSAVVGHSSGEIAAAYAAGALSFENTIICAYYRGLYMSKGSGTAASARGAMMAVGLSESKGRAELKPYEGRIALAAINSPSSLTFSGDEDAIIELKQELEARKVFVRLLKVEQAFHSHHMVPLSPAFEGALSRTSGFRSESSKVKLTSSVTARDSSARKMDASYWAANMTGVVRYSDALTGLLLDDNDEKNVDMLMEIGAAPALKGPSNQVMKSLNMTVPYLASLTRDAPAFESLLAAAGQLFSLGYPVDLVAVNSSLSIDSKGKTNKMTIGRKLQDLPTYPWKHGKFWAETRTIREHRFRPARHSLLGSPIPGGFGNHPLWRNYLRQAEIPWMQQHVVDGSVIFPAAGYMSMAMEAIVTLSPTFKSILLRDMIVRSALEISDADAGTEVVTELHALPTSSKNSSDHWYRFTICSFDENYNTVEHCHGLIRAEQGAPAAIRYLDDSEGYAASQKLTNRSRRPAPYYKQLKTMGIEYGGDFELISGDVESGSGFAMAPVSYYPSNVRTTSADACILHPTFLDATFHTIFAAIEATPNGGSLDETFIPTFIRSMRVSGLLNERRDDMEEQNFWVRTDAKLPGSRVAITNLSIQSKRSNEVLVDMEGFEATALGNVDDQAKRSLFFRIKWMPAFASLGQNSYLPPFYGIGEVLDTFVHQFPNSKILHLTSSLECTRDALRRLGGYQVGSDMGERRRFQSITPYSQSAAFLESRQELADEWIGLVDLEEPKADDYDLIIVSESIDYDVSDFLKIDGFVISDGVEFSSHGLMDIFQGERYSSFRKSTPTAPTDGTLTLVVSPRMSDATMALASGIEANWCGKVTAVTLAEVLTSPPSSRDIVSLVSLDEDIFFKCSADESYQFQAVQTLLKSVGKNILWLTHGATQESANPAQSIFVGLARTARSENEDMRLLTLDLPQTYDTASSSKRAVELLSTSHTEDEFAVRDGLLLIPRVQVDDDLNRKLPTGGHRQPRLEPFHQERNLALKIGRVGLLDTLMFEDDEFVLDPNLSDDDVEVEVKASSLNFRDIAASMGIIDDYRLGDECAGIVKRIGRNVKEEDFQPGDHVIAARPGQGSHRTIVRNPSVLCQKIGDMDFATAASIDLILVTAYYSLVNTARLQPSEYCLIHSAAGGVGQMAIQVAQMLGAKVIATCGSQAKRDFLKETFGLEDHMIFNSRDASFVEGVMKVTNGRGCDVALNQLAGDLLHATWGCIAPFGRLIEIGKRDIHENTKLDMEPFRNNVMYASVDLVTMFEINPKLLGSLMRDCYELVREGKIKPATPMTVVSYAEAEKGFRLLQMGKVFGKVVMVPGDNDLVPVTPPAFYNKTLFDPEKSYLLVGGLGGIGRNLAEWMLRKGARKLAFFSRSGAHRGDAKTTVEWLRARNVHVHVYTGDVADYNAVQSCVRSLGKSLGGVFQAAMVLRDLPFAEMTIEQWHTCVTPKIRGTYNLHKATTELKLDLDFFVGFSSSSAICGAMAQANYAAANVYIDSLMRHRRQNGLPGTTMNVGMVGGVGVVAEDAALRKVMERIGYEEITEEELFYQIEDAVLSKSVPSKPAEGIDDHQTITGVNLSRKDVYWASKPLFRNLYGNLDLGVSAAAPSVVNLVKALQEAATVQERTVVLMAAFLEKVATVLSVPAATIQPGNPLSAYGLDSIVAVEFRKWFSKTVSMEVSLFDILGARSIEALVSKVSGEIVIVSAAVEKPGATSSAAAKDSNAEEDRAGPVVKQTLLQKLENMKKPGQIPMSTFQNRIWFLHNLLDDPSFLNFVIVSHMEGHPKLHLMQRTRDELARRNDILRSCYFEGDDFAQQEVLEDVNGSLQSVDVSMDPRPQRALQRVINGMRSKSLDIEQGEMERSTLVKVADGKYAFVQVFHHIALDNGSTKSIMDQYTGIYDAFHGNLDLLVVPAPTISYSDFSVWHRDHLKSAQLKDDIHWWEEKFNGAIGASSLLPFAKSQRPAKRGSSRAILRQTLELPLLKRMKRVCARTNVTPFQFLLTAFRAFIHRYTQEDDMTILMVDGNRPHPDLEDVLGFFVNMIPLRCRNNCDTTFDSLLGEIKETALQGLAHSQVPFDVIVDAAKVEMQPSHFPLGQVAVNYQMYGKPPVYRTADFKIVDVDIEDIPTAVEMQLEATENPQTGLQLRFEYDSLLYGLHDMERFFENFTTFISSAVHDHLQPVNEIAMCGPKELDYLDAHCWAGNVQKNDWDNNSIFGKIMGYAESQPQATAILTSDGESINYADLVLGAQKIACSLKNVGIKPGQFVGVLCHPGIDMVKAMMGAVYMRCAYVPLDPKFAHGRLAHMIHNSSASVVLIGKGMEGLVSKMKGYYEMSATTIPIRSVAFATELASPAQSAAADPFYVVYTSGSTGKPKGVVLTQENTQASLSTHNKLHDFSDQDVILAHSSMSFDLSVPQIWGSLTSGATMALATQEARQDPEQLARFMKDAAVTITYIPATHFALLLEHNTEDLRQCLSYRRALFAGEYLPVRLVKAIYDLGTPVTVFNQWGPTETTAQTTSHKTSYPGPTDLNIPIGFPIPNNSHYVVDRCMKPVPACVTGELCVGGAQVGRGYLNPPDATEENFVKDPFASKSFRRHGWDTMYKTGDEGRFLSDGQIEFKGRISGDKQIKLRGNRIDLAEIENEIHLAADHLEGQRIVDVVVLPCGPAIEEAGYTDDRRLIAFIVLSRACTVAEQQMIVNSLRKALMPRLNDYMIPSGCRFMNTLSTLISSKIDRQMLMKSDFNLIYPSSCPEPGKTEDRGAHEFLTDVVQAFKDVLKIGPQRAILPTENFFDLGGQSILLLRLRAVLKRKLGAEIALTELFQHPTPLGITQKILGYPEGEQPASPIKDRFGNVDWKAESVLPNDSRYHLKRGVLSLPRSEVTEILVTGVDSFTGGHMLATLLATCPSAHIHVIGSEVELVPFDLSATFEQWNLFNDTVTQEALDTRTHCVPGTLSLAHFGLDDKHFQELGRSVQAIYHFGGQISLLKTYHDLKRLNIESTLELVELAKYGTHLTEIHYLSTWSVAHLQSWSTSKRTQSSIELGETSPAHFQPGGGEELGYFKSRWVAEMLLNEAAKRGFPVSIYRASAVTASLTTDTATPDDNFTHNMILGMIKMGQVPDIGTGGPESSIDFIPIDYLTTTLARLANSDKVRDALDKIAYYHIGNPTPLPLRALPALMAKIRDDGKAGGAIPSAEWVSQMRKAGGNDEGAQIQWSVFKEFLDLGHSMFSIDDANTREALEILGEGDVGCPPVDEVYLKTLLNNQDYYAVERMVKASFKQVGWES